MGGVSRKLQKVAPARPGCAAEQLLMERGPTEELVTWYATGSTAVMGFSVRFRESAAIRAQSDVIMTGHALGDRVNDSLS